MKKKRREESEKRREEKRREEKTREEKRREEKRGEERRREEKRREEKRREEERRKKKEERRKKIREDQRRERVRRKSEKKEWEERVRRKSQKKESEERVRRKKMQVREKAEKSRITVFFQWFVVPEGRKVGSLKRRVRSHLARWEMKKCTPLWREARFEVKMYKAPHVRTTFGRSGVVSCGRRKGFYTFPKVSKTWGFCSNSKNVGRRGTFEEDLQRCMSRGRRRDTWVKYVRRSGRWFLETGAFWSIRSSGLLWWFCDRCSTSYDLASLFRGRRSTLDRWIVKIAKRIGTRPLALHSTFHFWRKSRRIASFLMLSTSKIEEVSQTCFVFDVVKFKNWGSLAELLRFWCCQLQKLKSRRIASFSSLQKDSKIDRQWIDRQAGTVERQIERDKQIDR